ncbi:CYFA0S13e02344g1_1 [Cyberlindnera fabianii]|uniref:CYFA0S13e02344g1_1 n=1 Tax=Cyberlindnera fabianii TaxID=36022 RepID=A0A061B836_CYBFA|nr:CYFA0S13e02344g1_1 [Cyberlindnera fabianii]
MFQVQQPVMHENKHTLPPLSHIITAAALPFGQSSHSSTQQQAPTPPAPLQTTQLHHQRQHPHPQMSISSASEPRDMHHQRQLITPPSSTSSPVDKKDPPSPKYSSKQPTDRCTCKHDGNHIPRPRNAFILFRQQHHQSVLDEGNVIKTNPDVSRELGKRWRDLSAQEKDYWNKLAEEEKKRHAEKYPGYRYIPRRFGNKKGSCPYCRAKASIKAQTQALQQQKSLLYPDDADNGQVRTFSPSMTEEHAIAQSFLSLRNQPQFISPHHQQQPQPQPQPQQTIYYQQYPAYPPPQGVMPPHQAPSATSHMQQSPATYMQHQGPPLPQHPHTHIQQQQPPPPQAFQPNVGYVTTADPTPKSSVPKLEVSTSKSSVGSTNGNGASILSPTDSVSSVDKKVGSIASLMN